MKIEYKSLIALVVMAFTVVHADPLGEEREAKQAELDAACEAARQHKIVIERAEHIEKCVETEQLEDRQKCESFYADYGESPAGQPRLFYDLPECEKAYEYKTSYRSSDN